MSDVVYGTHGLLKNKQNTWTRLWKLQEGKLIIRSILVERLNYEGMWEVMDQYFESLYDYAIEQAQAIQKDSGRPTRVVKVIWE